MYLKSTLLHFTDKHEIGTKYSSSAGQCFWRYFTFFLPKTQELSNNLRLRILWNEKLECVCLRKWYQHFFSTTLKFEAYCITSQWGQFIEEFYSLLSYTVFRIFLLLFIVNFVFFSFSFLFFMNYQIYVAEYYAIKNINWGFPTVSRTVLYKKIPEMLSFDG